MPESSTRFVETLAILARHGVRSIVIGGVAAVVQGAPLLTFDIDVVPAMDDTNRDRLLAALRELEACYREHVQARIEPTAETLRLPGPHLLRTKLGILNLLPTMVGARTFDDLLPHSIELELGSGLRVMVLKLEMVVQLKLEVGRDKDRQAVTVIRRVLEERGRGGAKPG